MANRRSFKTDESFLEKLAIGAIGARAVFESLKRQGHRPIELERGSMSYKIWRQIKINRLRVPDILCLNCGTRIEARAKTQLEISMSHSLSDPERGWDKGLADRDVVALSLCAKSGERPVDWQAGELIHFTSAAELRKAYAEKRVVLTKPKGAQEGFELRVTWPAVVASSDGFVSAVSDSRLQFRRSADLRTISLALKRGDISLMPLVQVGDQVRAGQIIASVVPVSSAIPCVGTSAGNPFIQIAGLTTWRSIDMRHSLPTPLYTTPWGKAYVGDSLDLLPLLPPESIDLVVTSPPFALQRKKEYGNETEDAHVEWLLRFAEPIGRVLKPTGSFVLDLGGAYQSGRPVRSLYNFRVMLRLCDEHGFHLAEEFFWHNPAKLPSPIEWVNKRKIRAKDSVNTVWWFSKTEHPKADVRRVLVPYSERMQKLLQDAAGFYRPKKRPSGHDISGNFASDNGGAIPSNLLQIPNTESNSSYLRHCATVGAKPHPARFPQRLPSFFIEFLTDPGDTVLDIFAGSNTTGSAAEKLGRHWIAVEKDLAYVAASAFRFVDELLAEELATLWNRLHSDALPVAVHRQQSEMMLAEAPSRYPVKRRR